MVEMNRSITFVHSPEMRYEQNYGTLFSPVWAYTLASYLPDGWQPTVYDCVVEPIASIEPANVFAFSGINQDLDSIIGAMRELRACFPASTYIAGGPLTWSFEQEGKLDLLVPFDHIFILDGEETLPRFLRAFGRSDEPQPKVIRAQRFPLERSRAISFELLRPKAGNYYGAILEVSRGCPFLCEFCDIRVLPGNNRANNRAIEIIIKEIDAYHKAGITKFQFACDNFIGDPKWPWIVSTQS